MEGEGAERIAEQRSARRQLETELRRVHGPTVVAGPPTALPTGLPALDGLLTAGGLPRGRLAAVMGSAAVALLHRALAGVTRDGVAAWVDPHDRLAAVALYTEGVDLTALLVSRPSPGSDVVRAAAILQTGEARAIGLFDLLVVDEPNLTPHQAERLARIARLGAAALVLLTEPHPWLPAVADLVLDARRVAWRQDAHRLLGRVIEVAVRRQRGGRDSVAALIDLDLPQPLPPIVGLERLRPVEVSVGERDRGSG